jgi:hypothetical protein
MDVPIVLIHVDGGVILLAFRNALLTVAKDVSTPVVETVQHF